MSAIRLGFRTRIELPSCITKDYKYLVVDATPHGMNDYINPITLLDGDHQQIHPYNEAENQIRKEKCQQKRKEVISGLNRLIGQLTGILEYYNVEEREKVEEDVDRFIKKNHLAMISSPTYQPQLWDDPMTIHSELKRKQRDEEVVDFVRAKFMDFKEHMTIE
jgi:uncharacterized protein (UPF0297 family)